MNEMPSSAVTSWADFAAVGSGHGPVVTLILVFVQLVGLVAFGSGVMKVIYFCTPGHRSAPPTLGKPLFQIVFGLFALVPDRVYDLAVSVFQQIGWA